MSLAQLLPIPWSAQSVADGLAQLTTRGYGACLEGKILGFILCQVVVPEAEILGIAVDPAFQNRGIARDLLAYTQKILVQEGICHLFLEVGIENKAALSLYQSAGFRKMGYRKDYYGSQGRDALVLSLDLMR